MLSEVEDLEVLDGNKLSFMEKFWGNSPEGRSTEENKSEYLVEQSRKDVNESIEEKLSEGKAKSGMESSENELEKSQSRMKLGWSPEVNIEESSVKDGNKSSISKFKSERGCVKELSLQDSQVEAENQQSAVEEAVDMFEMIHASGVPNFKQCRIPVRSNLNIHKCMASQIVQLQR